MFQDYREITDLIVAAFGKTRLVDDLAADDFEALRAQMAERWGPVRLGNAITRVKSVFKYGIDNGLIEKAIRYGGEFKKPDKAVLRRHRAQIGAKMLEAEPLRRLINKADMRRAQSRAVSSVNSRSGCSGRRADPRASTWICRSGRQRGAMRLPTSPARSTLGRSSTTSAIPIQIANRNKFF
jgi:hypothetical protein